MIKIGILSVPSNAMNLTPNSLQRLFFAKEKESPFQPTESDYEILKIIKYNLRQIIFTFTHSYSYLQAAGLWS